jgi:hypothetical protein
VPIVEETEEDFALAIKEFFDTVVTDRDNNISKE